MPLPNENHSSSAGGHPGASSSRWSQNPYGGQYPTPHYARHTPTSQGRSFFRGQGVNCLAYGGSGFLRGVVLQAARAVDQSVLVQIDGEPQPRFIPNNPRFIS